MTKISVLYPNRKGARFDLLYYLDTLLGGRRTLDGKELAINAKDHRRADFQMHVRGPARNCKLQDFMKEFHKQPLARAKRQDMGDG